MAYFHCLIGGGSSGGGYELTVTCDADFAGTTITATDGVTTLTQTCPSASPYEVTFDIPNGGEWTVSGIISGATYSASIDIPDSLELHSTPEGSTVLPTDDIQTWLACAGITDKSYTTLNEVLADSTTLLALMSDDNAVDYLVRSTTWASGITADSTAMTDIGANNYCANTLLSNSTWLNAICNSTYFESVLNVKVPTMTSNTAPSGECFGDSVNSSYDYWKAFDKNTSTFWLSGNTFPHNLGYEFTQNVKVVAIDIKPNVLNGNARAKNFKVQSYDGSDWVDLYTDIVENSDSVQRFSFINGNNCSKYRVYFIDSYNTSVTNCCINELQFYGRTNV